MRASVFGIFLLVHLSHVKASVTAAQSRWSSEFLNQAKDLSCEPGDVRDNVTFLHGTKSGNFTKLGKVAELEVCMLLCCELDRCQAAFLAGTNCYAVTCFSQNHCVTAPALNNKWKPMVAFVRRFKNAVHVKAASNESASDGDQNHQSNKSSLSEAVHTGESLISSTSENATSNTISSKVTLKKKVHLEKFFTEEEYAKHSNGKENAKATIKTDETAGDDLELEELQKQAMSKRKATLQTRRHSAKYSLVSAAVATCLMAFLLSGCAVVAAKIRKRKESTSQYSEVPAEQN